MMLLACALALPAIAMETIDINTGWNFKKDFSLGDSNNGETVDLPHTWNKNDTTLYIAGRRNRETARERIDIMAFGNSGAARLYVNGREIGVAQPDEVNILQWKDVPLNPGDNEIVVKSGLREDRCMKRRVAKML